jgi:hypothetical protein
MVFNFMGFWWGWWVDEWGWWISDGGFLGADLDEEFGFGEYGGQGRLDRLGFTNRRSTVAS